MVQILRFKNCMQYALYHLNKPRFDFFDRYVPNWQGLKALDVIVEADFPGEFMAKHQGAGIDQL